MVESEADGTVTGIRSLSDAEVRINGGFFIFKNEIFDYLKDGEELVEEPFGRLMEKRELVSYRHDGFWQCMDTFKDKQVLDELAARDEMPWQPWKKK